MYAASSEDREEGVEDGKDTEGGERNADKSLHQLGLAIVEAGRWTGMWMVGGRRSELIRLLHWIKSLELLLH